MKQLLILATALLSILLTACSDRGAKEQDSTTAMEQEVSTDNNAAAAPSFQQEMTTLPAFTVQDVNGNEINLQSLKGKKVFVNLWASWCPPCRREMPSIEKLMKSLDQEKVAFVMLSLDDNFDKAKIFIKRQKLSLPIYYPAENLPPLFNVQGIPTTFIFDEKGNLFQRVDGGDDYDTDAYRRQLR
ncbi:MAG: TlpA family protein disulfide reductase [Chitinophagaceae bacterium]